MAEWVRRQLADDILGGRLGPGEKLNEIRLAERLGCSRTPVREAFRLLSGVGLVEAETNRSVVVVRPRRHDMHDLYETMRELEASCACLAAARLDDGDRLLLRSLPPWASAHAATGEEEDLHTILHRAAANPKLADLARNVRHRLLPYWRLMEGAWAAWHRDGAPSHARVVEAVLDRDGVAARAAMQAYVEAARATAEQSVNLPRS